MSEVALVAIPGPAFATPQRISITGTLERMTGRVLVNSPAHMAEAIALIVWDPETGEIDPAFPDPNASLLHLSRFSEQIERVYTSRYKGLPPHAE